MTRLGDYDTLNEDDPVNATVSMEELAERIARMNYGAHRFLSALVRARAKVWRERAWQHSDALMEGVRAMLDEGLH